MAVKRLINKHITEQIDKATKIMRLLANTTKEIAFLDPKKNAEVLSLQKRRVELKRQLVEILNKL